MSEEITIDLDELAEELLDLGLTVIFSNDGNNIIELQGCPDDSQYMEIVEAFIGDRTPVGMIIKEGALKQVYEDLMVVLLNKLHKKTREVHNQRTIEEIRVCDAPKQKYDIEVDG